MGQPPAEITITSTTSRPETAVSFRPDFCVRSPQGGFYGMHVIDRRVMAYHSTDGDHWATLIAWPAGLLHYADCFMSQNFALIDLWPVGLTDQSLWDMMGHPPSGNQQNG